ncbi:amidohydrolase [Thioalkalivibrio denitrificans]|uniref:Amidohydrolase n=1 Tax=Thioalkalivibrio denitrificans TaxID=108003 RepID=A0A1V3NQ37_9GAMM|nr:amidohydrolase family protein [Thioalkalivibrio denitrificans]OOG27114.1 amidohydrolase [Thioalkalivibrio denitrificans]
MKTLLLLLALCLVPAVSQAGEDLPIFDTHLHYSGPDRSGAAGAFTPNEIIAKFDRNHVTRAVVSSRPNEATLRLHEAAPDRIVPFLMPYRTRDDRYTYHSDPDLIPWLETWLERGPWRGIGEFHLFSEHANTPVIRDMARLAESRGLILQLHGDHGVVERLFEHAPEVTLLWAHAGTVPVPFFLALYLERHDNLYVDLSMRNERIAPDGRLDPDWAELFTRFPDRFMVGMDTFSVNRWQRFGELIDETRHWLRQLPPEVAEAMAWRNAQRLFPTDAAQ